MMYLNTAEPKSVCVCVCVCVCVRARACAWQSEKYWSNVITAFCPDSDDEFTTESRAAVLPGSFVASVSQ